MRSRWYSRSFALSLDAVCFCIKLRVWRTRLDQMCQHHREVLLFLAARAKSTSFSI
jgi:hypothetical protein